MWSRSGHASTALTRLCARRALLVGLVSLATGCMDSTPTSTAALPHQLPPAPSPVPQPPPVPSITGPSVLYARVSPSSYPGGGDSYLLSLGADSAFVIVWGGGVTYPGWAGRYQRADSVLVFHYDAWSSAGGLEGRGTLRGDTLFLRYNSIMQMTDFEDGVYVRAPRSQGATP
jgi:hypothetical protein